MSTHVPQSVTRRLPTVRAQILWAVNLSLAFAFAIFLVIDYQRGLAEQITEEHGSLESDAAIHHEVITRLSDHGPEAIQDYLDAIGSRPLDSYARSHNHYVIVCVRGNLLLAPKGHPALAELKRAFETAVRSGSYRAQFGDEELIVGSFSGPNQTVYVADYLANLRGWIIKDFMWRLLGIVILAILGAVIVNLLLLRLIARPLSQLVETVQRIGSGELGLQARRSKSAELDHLAQAISSMSLALEATDRQHRQEMTRARQIQAHLLPGDLAIPGVKMSHLYLPATDVAGDYYDVLPLPGGGWLVCIADVTGHGVPAAMTAAMLKALLLHAVEQHAAPAAILRFVNHRFSAVALADDFASVLLTRLEPAGDAIEYASAGHESGWLISPEGLQELPATGPLLGVSNDAIWESSRMPIAPGQRLLLFTDGLTEAFVAGKGLFGRKRVHEIVEECRLLPFDAVIPRLNAELSGHLGEHPRPDDLTILLLEFRGSK